jgi:polysaccharide biosynthesis protein PelF
MIFDTSRTADICLILEGTYPYVSGGVSAWTHNLIKQHSDFTFHLLTILPPDALAEEKYEIPSNVVGITQVRLQELPSGNIPSHVDELMHQLEEPLFNLTTPNGAMKDYKDFLEIMRPYNGDLGYMSLLASEPAFELVKRMYLRRFQESSFLDYFWSWRALMGGLFTMALVDLPKAEMYHSLSTGYAGMMAARAKIETGKPVVLTEHGIYTNERRIEVASADWLEETASKSLTIDHTRSNLRDFWADTFASFSRICYQSCDDIITLYEGNQKMQIADGAAPERMRIVVNGVDIDRFKAIAPKPHDRPTVALIGRVVPIKDIKSFIRASSAIKDQIPDVRVYVMGPTDEDLEYYQECRQMVDYMGLNDTITFTGQVNLDKYLPEIDVMVLSSISEAMPLTVLEAGACGIPTVATDVGACREIIEGRAGESPALGHGGIIVPLSNPSALAEGVVRLLRDNELYRSCSDAIRKRVELHYNKKDQIAAYQALYENLLSRTSTMKKAG